MSDMSFALQLTVIALGALLFISLLFIVLTRGLAWLASIVSREKGPEVAMPQEMRKKALIAAALMAYLEAERLRATGSNSKQEGEK